MRKDEMTVREAAERLGVTRFRIHGLIGQKQLQAVKRETEVGTVYLALKRADVERLAEERRQIAAGEIPGRGTRPKAPPERKEG